MPSKKIVDKPGKEQRAGTKLSDQAFPVLAGPAGQKKVHGQLDPKLRVYQSGGEAGNFIKWNIKAITLAMEVWDTLGAAVDLIELVDHARNEVYQTTMEEAYLQGYTYPDPKLGVRYAIPLACWVVYSADGMPLRRAG